MAANSVGLLAPLRALLDSFRICHVSILSMLSGLLVLYRSPQARPLFLDMLASAIGSDLTWRHSCS